jgi:palmitoyltransferase ZDHHC1/11
VQLSLIPALSAVLSIIYLILALFVVYYWYESTKSDPTDPTVAQQRECEANGIRFNGARFEFMCEVCNTHVLNDSKHCGACNRCVNAFDHHCRWINNCVGQKNYILFFRLIMITFFMTSVHAFTSAFNIYF